MEVKIFLITLLLFLSLLSGCIEQKENKVSNTPPVSSLSVSPFSSGYAPFNVTFYIDAHDSDGYIVSWSLDINNDGIADFTGNGSELPKMINYTYTAVGNYTAKLIVIDNNGSTDESVVVIAVLNKTQNAPPTCSISANVAQGYAPLKVSFTANVQDDGYIVKYTWNFDDGTTSHEKNPVHVFSNAGTYNVTLAVEDNGGLTASAYILITVLEKEWQPEYGVKYEVHVVTVIDGDTFDATFPNGSIERVRLLGVDTPETTASGNKPNEYDGITDLDCLAYWGIEAKNFAKSWLEGKNVYIEFDASAGFKGYYGRWLCYVYMPNNTDFNAELIKRGLARVYEEGTCSKESYYLTLQQQAMNDRIGLWSCMPEGGEGVVIITVHYDAAGDDRYNLNDEYVVIKNEGNEAVDMTGWTLSDQANHVYTFPSGFVLNAGATVTVYTGSGTDTSDKLYWGSNLPIWNNDGDTAYLKDNEGKLVDSWSW